MGKFPLDLDVTRLEPVTTRVVEPGVRRRAVASGAATASEVIGPIERGDEICGLTMGQFSLIDILEHVLDCVGPAEVAISTWTMGIYDEERAARFFANGLIRRIRWLVDPSIFGRRPDLAGALVQRYGAESFRAVNTRAKFATAVGGGRSVAIRSSMNLNPNRRLEHFDISESPELCAFFNGFVDRAFAEVPAGQRSQSRAWFSGLLGDVGEQREALPVDAGMNRSLAAALAED